MSDRALVDLAGNSEYLKIVAAYDSERLTALPSTAQVHALCFAYSRLKRYARLSTCLDELEARLQKGDTETLLFGLDDATPELHLMRAGAHIDVGRYAEGAAEAAKALAWYQKDGQGDTDIQLNALSLAVIGHALAGERKTAEEQLAALEKVRASAGPLGARDFSTIKSIALGRAYMALARPADALRAIESDRAFRFHAAIDNMLSGAAYRGRNAWRWQELPRLFIASHALLRVGRVADAKASYDRLLAVPETRQNGEIYWNALFDRGTIAESEGDREAAIEFYRRAIEALEEQRSSITNETSKLGFLRDKQEPFNRIVRLLLDTARTEEVFDYIERAKSRAMLDVLAGKLLLGEQSLDADPNAAQALPVRDRMQIQVSQVRAARPAPAGAAPSANAKSVFIPDTVDPETDFAIVSLPGKDLVPTLGEDEAVVQYYLGSDYLAIAVLSAKHSFAVRRARGTLSADVLVLRNLVTKHDSSLQALQSSAARIHDALVAPIENEIRGKRLTLVPYGALHYVPFGVLLNRRTGRTLIEDHTLRVMPSASLVRLLKSEPRVAARGMLVLANPTQDLPGAESEAKRILGMFPTAATFVGGRATRAAFIRYAGTSGRIHIAAHAKFFAEEPLASGILFAPTTDDSGMLTVRDLYRLNLDSDLVVLSACDTGISDVQKGDELVGL
ncbi:MAG TPA: CHAT domain-containing protein, partial [Burkholderiaceae bacterium]|nr:CHAT domain-containing protein [Burkholderiaceae bacterium]